MKGFKEAYYKRLKKDFDINKEDSAIFLYNMREYEDNPRIIAAFCCGRLRKNSRKAQNMRIDRISKPAKIAKLAKLEREESKPHSHLKEKLLLY